MRKLFISMLRSIMWPLYEEMKRLDAAFATHTELSKALSNPALSAADKVRVLSSAFGEKPDDYLLRFV